MWWVYSYFNLLKNNKANLLFSFLEFLLLHIRFVYLSLILHICDIFLLGRIIFFRIHKISTLNYMACSSSGKDPGLSSQWSPVRIWYTLPYCGWQVSIWSGLISRRKLERHQHLATNNYRGVAEWLKATVFKTVRQRPKLSSWVRILPPLPINVICNLQIKIE